MMPNQIFCSQWLQNYLSASSETHTHRNGRLLYRPWKLAQGSLLPSCRSLNRIICNIVRKAYTIEKRQWIRKSARWVRKQIVATVARQLQEKFGRKGFDEKSILWGQGIKRDSGCSEIPNYHSTWSYRGENCTTLEKFFVNEAAKPSGMDFTLTLPKAESFSLNPCFCWKTIIFILSFFFISLIWCIFACNNTNKNSEQRQQYCRIPSRQENRSEWRYSWWFYSARI